MNEENPWWISRQSRKVGKTYSYYMSIGGMQAFDKAMKNYLHEFQENQQILEKEETEKKLTMVNKNARNIHVKATDNNYYLKFKDKNGYYQTCMIHDRLFGNCQNIGISHGVYLDNLEGKDIALALSTLRKRVNDRKQFVMDLKEDIYKSIRKKLEPYCTNFRGFKYKSSNGSIMYYCVIHVDSDKICKELGF